MWNKVLCTLAMVPSGYPEWVDVPRPFLDQINSPLCIWIVRILIITAFAVCLLYAKSARPVNDSSKKKESAAGVQMKKGEQREEEK